jgi:hypothetical protein
MCTVLIPYGCANGNKNPALNCRKQDFLLVLKILLTFSLLGLSAAVAASSGASVIYCFCNH